MLLLRYLSHFYVAWETYLCNDVSHIHGGGLPSSISLTQIIPYRNTQRLDSYVFLSPVKLTLSIIVTMEKKYVGRNIVITAPTDNE